MADPFSNNDEVRLKRLQDVNGDERPQPKKIVKTRVPLRKKSPLDQFTETFFGDTAKGVMDYLFWDVFLPAVKDTVYDLTTTGVQRLLFGGDAGPARLTRGRGQPASGLRHVEYGARSTMQMTRGGARAAGSNFRGGNKYDFSALPVNTRSEALDIIAMMDSQIEQFGDASVADLLVALGYNPDASDRNWGWDRSRTMTVQQTVDGFILNVPNAIPLRK